MRNQRTQFQTVMLRALTIGIILALATVAIAGCAPSTLELPEINPRWPLQ